MARAAWVIATLLAGCVVGCRSIGETATGPEVDRRLDPADLEIVDCIVEGSVRQMGRTFTYQEPPRMARTTRFECASLGGTFVAYDPTAPNLVIDRWLPFAERGDVDAQHRLGLLYEGVMGAEPDYEKAAYWYGKAVKAGNRESMYALSILYEKGLGVERDVLQALDLYRQASGIRDDSLMLSSDAYRQIDEVRASLSTEVADLKAQRNALQSQVNRLEKDLARHEDDREVAALHSLVDQLNGQLKEKEQTLATLPTYRLLDRDAAGGSARFDFPELPSVMLHDKAVGQYYALVIGNNHYDHMPPLQTPHNDARSIAALLSDHYGFSTQLLLDANEEGIKRAIDTLNRTAGERDNILIYFAGHGHMAKPSQRSRLRGYWLPTNADRDQDVNWVDNWWITDHLDTASARRALVIADSCYGGVFSSDLPIGPVAQLPLLTEPDLEKKLQRRSRFVLASGGVAPAIDATSPTAEHSIFASALIDVLQSNAGSMSIVELYGRVFDRMYASLASAGLKQEPELRVIRAAGHESEGDFFFVAN